MGGDRNLGRWRCRVIIAGAGEESRIDYIFTRAASSYGKCHHYSVQIHRRTFVLDEREYQHGRSDHRRNNDCRNDVARIYDQSSFDPHRRSKRTDSSLEARDTHRCCYSGGNEAVSREIHVFGTLTGCECEIELVAEAPRFSEVDTLNITAI